MLLILFVSSINDRHSSVQPCRANQSQPAPRRYTTGRLMCETRWTAPTPQFFRQGSPYIGYDIEGPRNTGYAISQQIYNHCAAMLVHRVLRRTLEFQSECLEAFAYVTECHHHSERFRAHTRFAESHGQDGSRLTDSGEGYQHTYKIVRMTADVISAISKEPGEVLEGYCS